MLHVVSGAVEHKMKSVYLLLNNAESGIVFCQQQDVSRLSFLSDGLRDERFRGQKVTFVKVRDND